MRKPTPKPLEKKVLIMNRHCCCICQAERMYKPVAIHHIDGDNSNNKIENLAVLCLDHHSMADAGLRRGKSGSGRKLTPIHVREYKRLWETKVELTGKLQKKTFPLYQKKHLQIFHQFEISKIKNEIIVLDDKDKRLREKFAYFEQLLIEEFLTDLPLRKFLLQAYSELVIPGFITEERNKSKLLAESIQGLFLHLADPDTLPMERSDKKLFLKSLEVLEDMGHFAGEFSPYISPLKNACNAILDLAEIASNYGLKDTRGKILRKLKKIEKGCSEYESEKKGKQASQEREKRLRVVRRTMEKVKSLK